jgi:hypothetical protein
VQERSHRERVPARLRIEAEGIVADLVEVSLDPGNPCVEILTDDVLGDPDDAIADGPERLPQGGLPPQSRPAPAGEWHDRPPLRHGAIVETETAGVNGKRATCV